MLSQFDKYRSVTGERKYYINIYIYIYIYIWYIHLYSHQDGISISLVSIAVLTHDKTREQTEAIHYPRTVYSLLSKIFWEPQGTLPLYMPDYDRRQRSRRNVIIRTHSYRVVCHVQQ